MLLEREQELAVLGEAVAAARSGSGGLLLIDGRTGTGTTALLHRLADLAAADGALVLRSGGAAGERTFPFGAVRRLLLPLLTEPGVRLPPVAAPLLHAVARAEAGHDRGAEPAPPRTASAPPWPPADPRTALRAEETLPFAAPAGSPGTPGASGASGEPGTATSGRPDGSPHRTPLPDGWTSSAGEPGPAALADVLHRLHLLLAAVSVQRPVVLTVDDLCWVDDASLHALAHLAARLGGTRLLLAVVRKDALSARHPVIGEIAAAATHRVRARALSRNATARLVADRFGPDCPEEFALACHEATGGRPKDLKVLCDRARLRRLDGPAWRTAALRELGAALRRERLLLLLRREPVADAFAKAAAVLGEAADDELVARLAGLSQDQCDYARQVLAMAWPGTAADAGAPPSEAAGAGACPPEAADAVLQAMGDEESARRYREASALLDQCGAGPEEVAAPLLHVDRLADEWEIHQLRAAASAARHRGAPDAAVRYLSRALVDVPADSHVRAELLFELGVTELDLGTPSAARRHLAQAARLMPRLRRRAEVVSSTPVHIVAGDPQLADLVRETAAGLGTPRATDRQGRDLAMHLEARARYAGLNDPRLVASAARRLSELGDPDQRSGAVRPAERELRTVLLFTAAMSGQTDHRDIVRGTRHVLDHEPACTCPPSPTLELLPPVLLAADAPHVATSWLDAARLYAVREDAPGALARVEAQRGLLLLGRGEAALARECTLRAFRAAEGASPEETLLPRLALGWIAFALDDQELAGRVIDGTDPPVDLRLFALHRALRGRRAETHGNLPVALAQYLDCGRVLEQAGWLNPAISTWRERAAAVQHRLGRTAEAARLAAECHESALVWGAPSTLGRALALRGTLTDGPRGLALLRAAVDTLEAGGSRIELARALVKLGRRLQRDLDPEGDRILSRGRRLAAGLRTPPPASGPGLAVRPARAITAGLTRAEMKVVERATRGLSNREIAEELDVTLRAVERHLTSSYRKLGISGREDLAAALSKG
ncbi:AAA family ATPase [Streptomyces glaucus]|uniref:LuxR C-terminal-related transcriptional regulator n=1 Tax=Streptomyces glaucus TaxID=284029 RepID=A0ABN3KDJ7_9ACTN